MTFKFRLRAQGDLEPVILLFAYDARFKNRQAMYSTGRAIPSILWDKANAMPVESVPAKGASKKIREFWNKPVTYDAFVQEGKKWRYETVHGNILGELREHLEGLLRSARGYAITKTNASTLDRAGFREAMEGEKIDEVKLKEEKVERETEIFQLWEHIIKTTQDSEGNDIEESTKEAKRQTLTHVRNFSAAKGFTPTLLNLNKDFYFDFTRYLKEKDKPLSPNTIGKHIKEIKAFLREAEDRGHEVCLDFQKKSFRVIRKSTFSTYLSTDELRKLLDMELTGSLAKHRDVFVAACFVGSRHSDWSQIRPENVVILDGKEHLSYKQQKTGGTVHVPVHPAVKQILDKYKEDGMPKEIFRNKIAEAIRKVCKKAELGKVVVDGKPVEKWTTISTHTARRSFATNAYLSKSMKTHDIMAMTGHKSESSFLKYLKLNGQDHSKSAAESEFFDLSAWSLQKVS